MTAAKERQILFRDPMVRAILAGTMTQTRRVVKPQPQPSGGAGLHPVAPYCNQHGLWAWVLAATGHGSGGNLFACPYGQPGDRLWVREAWRTVAEADGTKPRDMNAAHRLWFEADAPHQPGYGKLRPAMFMPRWASRITLEVTSVRVERLQDMSEADAIAEGVSPDPCGRPDDDGAGFFRIGAVRGDSFPIARYAVLWESINGPGSWDANPWVWVVAFRLLDGEP